MRRRRRGRRSAEEEEGARTTGAVVAVSPVITIWDRAQRFFMAELGGARGAARA